MVDPLSPQRLNEDAVYLGLLTARGVKPLSRLEYPVAPRLFEFLRCMGLRVAELTRVARNRRRVRHVVFASDAGLIDRYLSDFEGRRLCDETPRLVRMEAHYFGYPPCCAEAYIRTPHAENGLPFEDQALLFHRACLGCVATPHLLPLYRDALAEARQICSRCDLPDPSSARTCRLAGTHATYQPAINGPSPATARG